MTELAAFHNLRYTGRMDFWEEAWKEAREAVLNDAQQDGRNDVRIDGQQDAQNDARNGATQDVPNDAPNDAQQDAQNDVQNHALDLLAMGISRFLAGLRSAWKARTLSWFFRSGPNPLRQVVPRGDPEGEGPKEDVSMEDGLAELDEKDACRLIHEIEKARNEWAIALQKLDYVVERDQIDYAIYSLEAAEKRYEMLLRQAKKYGVSMMDPWTGRIRVCRKKY
jgi:hypothetical protein